MFGLSTRSPACVCFGDHVASKFGSFLAPRRPKAVPLMSLVVMGDGLGSSLGSPNPPLCIVWTLLSSFNHILDVSSARSEVVCCNHSIFLTPRTKNDFQNLRIPRFCDVLSEHTISSLGRFLALSCFQIWIMFSLKAANCLQKTARECRKVSQRTPRLQERPPKDAQELLKRAPGDLRELPDSPKVPLQALRMRKTFIRKVIISSAASLHVKSDPILEFWTLQSTMLRTAKCA